jgi:hypothetical protein
MSDRVLDQLNLNIYSVDLIWLCWEYAGAPFCMTQGPRCEGSYIRWGHVDYETDKQWNSWEPADARRMAMFFELNHYLCCPYDCIHRLPNNK